METYFGTRFLYPALVDLDCQFVGFYAVELDSGIILDLGYGNQEFCNYYVLSSFFRAAGNSILLSISR